MTKFIAALFVALALALAGASWSDGSAAAADWSSGVTPAGFHEGSALKPADGCAKIGVSKFSMLGKLLAGRQARGMLARKPACGGRYPQHWIVSGDGYCFLNTDWGPGTSPRYTMRPCF